MIRVGVVAFHNTIPLAWNLDRHLKAELVRDTPRRLAEQMEAGALDLCIVPVEALARHPEWKVVPNLGIASRGEVGSVRLMSRSAASDIHSLYLDPASRTSNLLARLVWEHAHPDRPLEVVDAGLPLEERLGSGRAAVSIGDEALFFQEPLPVDVDLGAAWHAWTKLPFVYALWAGPAGGDAAVHAGLSACYAEARSNLPSIIPQAVPDPAKQDRVRRYLEEHICYRLGAAEEQGLNLYLDKGRRAGWLPDAPEVVCHA